MKFNLMKISTLQRHLKKIIERFLSMESNYFQESILTSNKSRDRIILVLVAKSIQ